MDFKNVPQIQFLLELVSSLVLLDAAGMPFIRHNFAGRVRASIDQMIKFESKPKRENTAYPKDVLKERLNMGMKVSKVIYFNRHANNPCSVYLLQNQFHIQ